LSNMTVSVIIDSYSFESLEDEWNSLLDRNRSGSVFLTWDWLYTWWSKFRGECLLNIVTVRDSTGKLVGLGPFCVNDQWGGLPVKALTFLGSSHISSEYLDIISDPDYEYDVALAIFNSLRSNSLEWDCLIFTDTLRTSSVYNYFKRIAFEKSYSVKETVSEICPYLNLSDSQDATLSKFKSQLRSTIKRRTKKLEKKGVKLKVATNSDEVSNYIEKLFDLHQKRWNIKGKKGNFKDDIVKSFHAEVAMRLLSRGLLGLYTLQVDDKIIAALYSFQFKGTLFYFQSGFDPEWSSYSPGTVLMWKCVSDAIDRGLTKFDYLRGDEFYKSTWSDQSKNTYSLIFMPPRSIKINTYFILVDIKNVLKTVIKRMILIVRSKR